MIAYICAHFGRRHIKGVQDVKIVQRQWKGTAFNIGPWVGIIVVGIFRVCVLELGANI